MYYDDEESGNLKFVAGLLIGAVLGASIALLAAPESGKRTRRRLQRALSDASRQTVSHWEDLSDDMQSAVRAGRRRVGL